MARDTPTLETPFRKGEKVITTAALPKQNKGAKGKIQLANGLGVWRRYWVRFNDGQLVGQVNHDDLVRPQHKELWLQREEEKAQQASQTAAAAATPKDTAKKTTGGPQIPEALLERSRAAKARLLG